MNANALKSLMMEVREAWIVADYSRISYLTEGAGFNTWGSGCDHEGREYITIGVVDPNGAENNYRGQINVTIFA